MDRITFIEKLQSYCANMSFPAKSRYERIFHQITHKGDGSAMNHIKRLQNAQALSVSLGNTYSEYQPMHTFLDNFHQDGKYSAQIDSYQAELMRKGNIY